MSFLRWVLRNLLRREAPDERAYRVGRDLAHASREALSLSIEGATKSKGVRVQSVPARLYLDPVLAPFFVAGYENGARS